MQNRAKGILLSYELDCGYPYSARFGKKRNSHTQLAGIATLWVLERQQQQQQQKPQQQQQQQYQQQLATERETTIMARLTSCVHKSGDDDINCI